MPKSILQNFFYNECEAERQEEIEKVEGVQAEDIHDKKCPAGPSSPWASRWWGSFKIFIIYMF